MITDSNSDLPGSLEEFGLSKYEARAYFTMIGKGSLAVSEIAYYANLPRTKVYQTVKKLEKKRLAVISKQKPLICSAIPPDEAFAEILNLHERRIRNMRKTVEELQKINDEGQRPRGSEEKRYFILDASSALEKISSFIANSRSSVAANLDLWGLRLITQCKSSLVNALTRGVQVRMIVATNCIANENVFQLPEDIELRTAEVLSNLIIVDSTHIVSVDSSNGKAALFSSTDSFGMLQAKNFEEAWTIANEMKSLLGMNQAMAAKAIKLIGTVENSISAKMLEYAISGMEMPPELIDAIDEKCGLNISSMSGSELMELVDSALRISCLGSLKHDRSNNIVSLQSKVDTKHILPWALVLTSYFKRSGNEPRLMLHQQQQGRSLQLMHVRLSKPLVGIK
jgi:sugar-specific transcriptional regulator TrmB